MEGNDTHYSDPIVTWGSVTIMIIPDVVVQLRLQVSPPRVAVLYPGPEPEHQSDISIEIR